MEPVCEVGKQTNPKFFAASFDPRLSVEDKENLGAQKKRREMTVDIQQYTTSTFPPPIDLTDAIQDSPRFRAALAQHIAYFTKLETRLTEMLKNVSAMIEFSKNYVNTFYKFTVSVNQLCEEGFSGNALAQATFQSLSEAFGHTVNLSRTYYEQANVILYSKLSAFIKEELAKVQEARAHFDGMSASMDEALQKNAGGTRTKPADAVDGRNALTAIGACFAHTTLDYVAQINIAHAHKDHVIIDALWSLVRESSAFFSKGHATFDEWTAADNGAVADTISAFAAKSKLVERKMQDVHSLVPKEMFQHPSGMPIDADVIMEGYLYKRSSNAFKTWNRRWFQIKGNKLLYSHRSNDQEQPTVMEENLMLCLVRPAPSNIDRVGCFELVTPTRCHLLQADSESLCNDWMRALQRTIHALHENGEGTSSSTHRYNAISTQAFKKTTNSAPEASKVANGGKSVAITTFEQIRKVDGNDVCADCSSPSPKWVSINLGVVLCIECSGVHRSLGVQVSKVRSLTMDSIDGDLKDVLLSLGNKNVNSAYLKYLPTENVIPQPCAESSSRPVREAWIKAKYVERRFAIDSEERARTSAASRQEPLLRHKISIGSTVNRSASYVNVKEADITKVELAADVDPWSAELSIPQSVKRLSSCGSETAIDATTDIVTSADWDQVSNAAIEGSVLGLLSAHANGFEMNGLHCGTSLLHIATRNGQTAAVEFLLLNGAKINMLDDKLNTPLHLASLQGNTLQVCQLLRRGADKNLMNVDGKTPLDIAVEGKHADIVTLFRVTDMRDEFSECNNPMDKTVDDVISDIARRAAVEKAATCT